MELISKRLYTLAAMVSSHRITSDFVKNFVNPLMIFCISYLSDSKVSVFNSHYSESRG